MADDARSRWQARYEKSRVRDADFTTLSGVPVEPAYGTDDSEWPGRVPVHPRAVPHRLPRPDLDDPPVRGLRQRRADQRALQDDPGPRWRRALGRVRHADADGPRLRRPDVAGRGRPLRRGHRHRRRHGAALRRHRPRRGHHLDDDQRARRARVLHDDRRRRARGRRHRQAERHAADRHLQGVHRPEGVALRARAAPAADRRPDGVLRRGDPGVQAALGLRLPHPRGRLDGRAGARVHARRRLRVRRARALPRPRRRRVRARAVVLLRRPRGLLRGDREVPRRPPDLGALAARRLRREDREGAVAALPHPDRRGVADRPAALQQRRAHRHRGALRRARRHQLAAHQRPRRDPRAAQRAGRRDRPAHPAGDHGGDRRRQRRGPARGLVVRRGAHRQDRGRGQRDLRQDPVDGRLRDSDSPTPTSTASPRPRTGASGR